ncbi:hypothetical protein RJ640_010506 [Escallonia rubra]|uniref:CCHC-type domain-containing protein n=1 Tax=Escallonia rubra TaxID=112253 RepID=A0AA88URP3_9ASTE|nr:hypothetical protein RJ640_010506 [Escallonia rubra]
MASKKMRAVRKVEGNRLALYKNCIEDLLKLNNLNQTEFLKAVRALKDDKNAIAFMTMKGHPRLAFLRGRQKNKQNNRGRSPTRGRSKSRGKSKSKGRTIVCRNCNNEGHKKNDCTEPKKKKGAGGRQGDDEGANMWMIIPKCELQKNLISVSGLDREGYFVAFGEKQWKVTKGSMVVARGEKVGTLYTLSENQRTTLWHHRLGHLSESGMKILHSKNALPGMKNIQLDLCEACVYGKQRRVSFQKDGKERKTERLELVHTDVCEPTTVKSLGEDGRISRIESPKVLDETTDTEIGAGDQQQVPETLNLRRSSQLFERSI